LHELACVGELPLPQPSPPNLNKRERDEQEYVENYIASQPNLQATDLGGLPRPVVGSRRAYHAMQQAVPSPPPQQQSYQHQQLPVYTEELGRMPLHGQVGVTTPALASSMTGRQYVENLQAAGQPGYGWQPTGSQVLLQQQSPQNPSNQEWDGGDTSGYSYPMVPVTTSIAVPTEPEPQVFPPQVLPSSIGEMDPYLETQVASQWAQTSVQQQQQQQQFVMDDDLVTMWMNAPTGFGWVSLISSFGFCNGNLQNPFSAPTIGVHIWIMLLN
jgi:hypothetical protein